MKDFTVSVGRHPDHTVIAVTGELDLETCPALAEAALVTPLRGTTWSCPGCFSSTPAA